MPSLLFSPAGAGVAQTLIQTSGQPIQDNTSANNYSTGNGAPNGVVVGSPGDLYINTAGGAATTLWVKESGAATNTGWVGK